MKLTDRVFEAIDLDGRDKSGARKHIRSKSVLGPVIDRIIKSSNGMLKSLGISSQKHTEELDTIIRAFKIVSNSVEGIKRLMSSAQGISSLRNSGENKLVKKLFKDMSRALKIIQTNKKSNKIEATSKKQLDKFISDTLKELEIIKKEVIKDL